MSTVDLSHIGKAKSGGRPPLEEPLIVVALAKAWMAEYETAGHTQKPMSIADRKYRASWTTSCDRQMYYLITSTELSEPMTVADYWRFGMGSMVHDALEKSIASLFPDAECEVAVDLRPIGLDGAATVDIIVTIDGRKIVVEVKSINGYGFKMAVTSFRSPPEGPRYSAVVQGALAALAADADELRVGYLSLENLSPSMALDYADEEGIGRFAAEWAFGRDEFEPVARHHVARVNRIFALAEDGILPTRQLHDPFAYPAGAVIEDPMRKMWVVRNAKGKATQTGTCWECDYCSFRTKCIDDKAGGATSTSQVF